MAEKHLSAIAGVISELNPDFINLCEVESCDELNYLLQDPSLASQGYVSYMIQGTDSATGQDVGMLTKIDPIESLYRTEVRVNYPIPSTTCKSSYTGSYGVSKHYITSMVVNNLKIAIISLHLLAYPDDVNRCVQREAQASVIQQLVQPYLTKGYEVMIIGDINDWDGQVKDVNGDTPISQVLSILKGQGVGWTLYNVAQAMPQNERYSCWYDDDRDCVYDVTETSSIDHILVSPGLFGKISNVFFAHDLYEQQCDGIDYYFSDHWPLVVVFYSPLSYVFVLTPYPLPCDLCLLDMSTGLHHLKRSRHIVSSRTMIVSSAHN
jgi:exonuclease III